MQCNIAHRCWSHFILSHLSSLGIRIFPLCHLYARLITTIFVRAHEGSTGTVWDPQHIMATFQLHLYSLSGTHQCASTTIMLMKKMLSSSELNVPWFVRKVLCFFLLYTQVISCLWSPDYFNYNHAVWPWFCCPWLFLLSPITSLLKQPEQMFASILLTTQANSGAAINTLQHRSTVLFLRLDNDRCEFQEGG